MTKKTLTVRPLDERTEAPAIEKRGRDCVQTIA